jgi:hypothetical protein
VGGFDDGVHSIIVRQRRIKARFIYAFFDADNSNEDSTFGSYVMTTPSSRAS